LKKYLLENYPLIWNTKLLPMLGLAACGHVFFFLLGYIIDKDDLYKGYYSIGEGFFPLPFLLHLIISILLLVFWLMQLSKNNAFKHFYPSNQLKLLGLYTQYFIIIFAVLTFSLSFMAGEKTHLLVIDRPFYGAEEGDIVQGLLIASLFISLLVLCVRITEVRTLLLTIVFSGVLSLVLGMVSAFLLGISSDTKLFVSLISWMYVILPFIAILVVATNLATMPKLFSGILINFSLLFFTPALYGSILLIFKEETFNNMPLLNYGVLLSNFLFILLYAPVLHQWRAVPE
jgi:putative membrane protein